MNFPHSSQIKDYLKESRPRASWTRARDLEDDPDVFVYVLDPDARLRIYMRPYAKYWEVTVLRYGLFPEVAQPFFKLGSSQNSDWRLALTRALKESFDQLNAWCDQCMSDMETLLQE